MSVVIGSYIVGVVRYAVCIPARLPAQISIVLEAWGVQLHFCSYLAGTARFDHWCLKMESYIIKCLKFIKHSINFGCLFKLLESLATLFKLLKVVCLFLDNQT